MNSPDPAPQRRRTLTLELVSALGQRIRDGAIAPGERLPTEASIMAEFGVSRTVVREAISRLQAAGLVQTRHGIGSFATAAADRAAFRVGPEHYATLQDVIALLELRIGVESEAAGLAAQRRSEANLANMRSALAAFSAAIEGGGDAVAADFQFHLEVARATGNSHFIDLLASLGSMIIPRARLADDGPVSAERQAYLQRVNAEHESILDAIANHDADAARAAMRTHLTNSRERRRRASQADAEQAATRAAALRRA